MGKYDDAIGGIDISLDINEVLDDKSHKKVANKLEETRKRAEEPIRIKIDSGEMDELLKQEEKIVKTIKQLGHLKINTKGISGLLGGNMSKADIQKTIDALNSLYEVQNRIRQVSGNTKRAGSDFLSGFSSNDIKTDLLPKLQGQLSELNKLGMDNIEQLRERERLQSRLSKITKKDLDHAKARIVDGGDAEIEAKAIENVIANRKQVAEEMKLSGLFSEQEVKDIERQNKGLAEQVKLLRSIRVAKVKDGERIVVQKGGEGSVPIEEGELPPARKSRGKGPKVEEKPQVDTKGESIKKEMREFALQFGNLQKEIGASNELTLKWNNLMYQVQQGALTAAEAVAKLREEMGAHLPDKKPDTDFISEEDARKAEEAYDRLYEQLEAVQNKAFEAEKELKKLQKTASVYGFGSDKTPAQQGRIQSILEKDGRNQYVVDMLKKGYKPTKTSSGEYGFDRPDVAKGAITITTKTEYEYAQYLSQKIQELNVGWDEGLKILQSQNGQLEAAQEKVKELSAEEDRIQQERDAAYEAQAKAHYLWNKQQSAGKSAEKSHAIEDENAKLEERNRLVNEYIEALRRAKSIEAKGYASPEDMPEEDFKIWNDAHTAMQQMSMRPNYDDIKQGVRERLAEEERKIVEDARKNKFARTINGKTGRFTRKKPEPQVSEAEPGQLSLFPDIDKEIDKKEKLVEANEKVVKSQKKTKEALEGAQLSMDVEPKPADESAPSTEPETTLGEAAEKAANSKKKLAEANKEVAASTTPSVEGLEAERKAIEDVGEAAEKTKKQVSDAVRVNADSKTPSFTVGKPEVLYDEMYAFAEAAAQREGNTVSRVAVDTNALGEVQKATISYYNKATNETITEMYQIDQASQESIDSVDRLVLASKRATKGIADYERALLSATNKQNNFAISTEKTLNTMSAALDANANRTLIGKDGENEVRNKLEAIKAEIEKIKQDPNGTLDPLPEREFLAAKKRIAELIQETRVLIREKKNAAYGETLESNAVDAGTYRKDNLKAQINEWKRAGIYVGDLQKKGEALLGTVDTISDHAGLKKYLIGIKEANALAKLATQDKKSEKEAKDALAAIKKQEQAEKAKDERVIAARKKQEEAYNAWWQKALFDKERAPNLKYGKTTANSVRRKFDATEGAVDAIGVTNPEVLKKLDDYKRKVLEVEKLRERFASDSNAAEDTGLVKQFQKAAYEAEQLRRGIKAITDEEQKMMQMSEEQGFYPMDLTSDQMANLEAEIREFAKTNAQGKVEIKGWNDEHTKMYYTVTNSKGAVDEMTVALGQGTNSLYKYRTATKETGTLFQQVFKGIKVKAKELLSFVIGGGSIYKVIELLRQGIQYVREIDLTMTELKKVTDETEETYDKFLDTAAKTADKVGSTIQKVVSSTADWARLNI